MLFLSPATIRALEGQIFLRDSKSADLLPVYLQANCRSATICPPPALMQSPNRWHCLSSNIMEGIGSMLSGLLHQMQLSGHPLKKIFVLTPAPSCNENLCMLKTVSNLAYLAFTCYTLTLSRTSIMLLRCEKSSFISDGSKIFFRLKRSVRSRSRKISW